MKRYAYKVGKVCFEPIPVMALGRRTGRYRFYRRNIGS